MMQAESYRSTPPGPLRRHPVVLYAVLAFGLSWCGITAAVGAQGLPLTPEEMEAHGGFVYGAMLAGPSLAGVLTGLIVTGWPDAFAPLAGLGRWRIPGRWYAVALLTAPVLVSVSSLVAGFLSDLPSLAIAAADDPVSVVASSIAVGIVVGTFEEVGWTGFALRHLRRTKDLIQSGICIGVIWGAWHFLVFWEADSFTSPLSLALLVLRLFGWLPAYRVLMVFLYDRTESLAAVVLMHASLVASQFILIPSEPDDPTLVAWLLVLSAVLWLAVGALRWIVGRKSVLEGPSGS